jgi:hypothetical protein
MSSVSEEKLSTIKTQMVKESKNWNHKPRFGLFSFAGSNHIGDGYYDKGPTKALAIHPVILKGVQSEIKPQPIRLHAGTYKRNQIHSHVFQESGYLAQNSPYEDQFRNTLFREDCSDPTSTQHKGAFRPSHNKILKIEAPYKYMTDPGIPQEKRPPKKNFLNNPGKKGFGNTTSGHLFSAYQYMEDPYDRPKELNSKEINDHRARLGTGAAFRSTSHARDHFVNNYQQYCEKGLEFADKRQGSLPRNIHTAPFRPNNPAKLGYNKTLNKLVYMAEGDSPQTMAKSWSTMTDPNAERNPPWKETYNNRTEPTPSVKNYNSINRPRQHIAIA